MLAAGAEHYTIRRIRLINFHNFVDETIEIRHGGHLFLLGDNASGKTTLLDAVHYVLTAGEGMEFNSAARIAGSREEGRRIQGVILRYNVDTGPLNPTGGVTYAALEICGRRGTPTTLAVGMRAGSMDEKVQRWGIIRECPLEDVPLLVHELQGTRPASREEMRDALGSASGYFSNITVYEREVANRFFGGAEAFAEVRRLLSMGKSYREIVSHTADYHQLFRSLLPEPRTEMFEQVITALRSLDQATADLAALETKHTYLIGLRDLVARIAAARTERQGLTWLLHDLTAQELQRRTAELEEGHRQREAALVTLKQRIETCRNDQEHLQKQLNDLRLKDTSGVIHQEKDMAAEYERLVHLEADARAAVAETVGRLDTARQACDQLRQELRTALAAAFAAVTGQAAALPFSALDLAAALDAARRQDAAEDVVDAIPVEPLRERVLEAVRQPEAELAVLRHRREDTQRLEATLRARLEAVSAEEESGPTVTGYAEAVTALRRALVTFTPLYAGLEWAPATAAATAAAIEEAIGEDVLATFMVPPDQFAEACRVVFAVAPGIRVAAAPEYGDLADWMHASFDLARSDAAVLRCVASEMLAHTDPEVLARDGFQALRFRAHERRLHGKPARLIGPESRRAARRREIEAIRVELAQAGQELAELDRREAALTAVTAACGEFRRLLDGAIGPLARQAHDLRRDVAALVTVGRERAERDERLAGLTRERTHRQERLAELRAVISREGLDQLEQHIARAQRRYDALRDEDASLHVQLGGVENQLKGVAQALAGLAQQAQAALAHREAEAGVLRARCPAAVEVAVFVREICSAERFPDKAAVETALATSQRDEGILTGQLQSALLDPDYSAAFGFAYDDVLNQLVDRRGQDVAALVTAQSAQIGEQREVINQKTQDLFRRLIVEQLLSFLSHYVRDLRDMVKRVNHLLGDRSFGGSRYHFQVQEVDRYQRLVEIVEHYNPFQAEQATQEIRAFFEDHKQDILDTEVGEVPDALDYRNWFHYDMRVSTTEGDGVVMDRHTKSVGSGGEQAVPNYLLILTIADFLYRGNRTKLQTLLFDEAFYGIDAGRRDQILGFATDIGLQLIVASPDQDGVRQEVAFSTTLLVVKDEDYDVHLYPYHWENPAVEKQPELLDEYRRAPAPLEFGAEL
jgi:energy-coupling factor transporter ATP-binding protein EcfA2